MCAPTCPTHTQLDPDEDEEETESKEPPKKRSRGEPPAQESQLGEDAAQNIDDTTGYWDMSFSSAFSRSLRLLRRAAA